MIGKYHPIGTRVVVDTKDTPNPQPQLDGKTGTIIIGYDNHQLPPGRHVSQFWGYIVRLDNGDILCTSRHMLSLAENKPATPTMINLRRGNMDQKVSWKDCAWQPRAA